MYFPYLRSKREEVLAVLEANFLGNLTIPILEPVQNLFNRNGAPAITLTRLERATQHGRRFALITNSANGNDRPSIDHVHAAIDRLSDEAVFPAFEIRGDTELPDVQGFAEQFAGRTCIVVHRNHVYSAQELGPALIALGEPVHVLVDGEAASRLVFDLPACKRVLVRDGFDRQLRNADYPQRTNFDDLLHRVGDADFAFDGFGDFAIVGRQFMAGGGKANNIALHLTEVTQNTVIAHHFVSRTAPNATQRQMYFDALEQLLEGVSGRLEFNTVGVAGVSSYRRSEPLPGSRKSETLEHHASFSDLRKRTERKERSSNPVSDRTCR